MPSLDAHFTTLTPHIAAEREGELANRDLAFVLAALLPLSTGCADSTQPVSPAPYEDPAPQPSPPPASPGPPAPPGSAGPDHIYLANVDGSGLRPGRPTKRVSHSSTWVMGNSSRPRPSSWGPMA